MSITLRKALVAVTAVAVLGWAGGARRGDRECWDRRLQSPRP